MKSLLVFVVSVLLAGCFEDPKAATKANFKKAAEAKFAEVEKSGEFCIGPREVPHLQQTSSFDLNASRLALKKLESSGLLLATRPAGGLRVKEYNLTEQGELYFEENRGFCFVRAEVVEVLQFTEPADLRGQRVSKATLLLKVVPVKADPVFVKKAGELNPAINEEPKETQIAFVLTSEGWQAR